MRLINVALTETGGSAIKGTRLLFFGGESLGNVLENIFDRGYQIRIAKAGNAVSCANVKGDWPGDGGDVIVYPCTNNVFYPVNEAWQFVSAGSNSPWFTLRSSITDFEGRRGLCVKAQGSEYTGSQLWTVLNHDCNPGDRVQQFALLRIRDDIFLLFHRRQPAVYVVLRWLKAPHCPMQRQ